MADVQSVKNELSEIGSHVENLAAGLLHAAPPQEQSKPLHSVQYLLELNGKIDEKIHKIEGLFPSPSSQNTLK